MQKILLCLCAIVALTLTATAQQLDLNKKQTKAFRTEKAPKIDGELTEIDWQNAPNATDLVQLQPVAGGKPRHRTEIKVMYDNAALYVGAMMYDTAPDSILQQVTQRDEIGNSDWFGIFIDPYKGMPNILFLEKMKIGMPFGKVQSRKMRKVGSLKCASPTLLFGFPIKKNRFGGLILVV